MNNLPDRQLVGDIDHLIITLRGQRAILDADLAAIYGVSTKRLNEQVKRNEERFSVDFAFQLTLLEKAEVVANCDHRPRPRPRRRSPDPVLERTFSDLVNQAYALTPAEIALMWQTAPPRMPIPRPTS